jgi:hypothetical protein
MTSGGWTEPSSEIEEFLRDYDARGKAPGGDPAALFAPTFLAVDPARALALTPAALAAVLPARRRMFDEAGVGDLRRTTARELRLDERHALVSARWRASRTDRPDVELTATFLVRSEPDGWRVLVYLNHADVAALLA